jgi:hypothetical protein
MQNRPLRPFEQGAHLHVLDWAHTTARVRFQAAGAAQVKAAAKAFVDTPADAALHVAHPPSLPALEAAINQELRKLYALGHATVRSEIDHQLNGRQLPIGLSAAPEPPNLRKAKTKKGRFDHCATCKMYDASSHSCWGYGNWPVKPNQLCDSFERDPKPKTLALDDARRDPGRLRARARLVAQATAHAIWQAIQRARLQGISDPKRLRQLGRDAGTTALGQAATHHAGGAINGGRHAAALTVLPGGKGQPEIVGARYTSVLDKNTCGPCADADTGQLIPVGSPEWIPTPNPACMGGDRCRCIHVYQLSTEVGSEALPIAAGG